MATLVLGTVGTLLGGPIGGALGALAGQEIDHAVLAPKGRQGPRLGDLSVQTSSYGASLPRLFGTMRVAGTVIWATDLREDSHSSGSAKTGKTTSYSYSASFAVALSARPILSIGRIWADGNLLRGSAGDWKSETGFRLYLGTEDQAIDPLIAAAEGLDAAPAHRGTAYAVFEGMQLADFGNRIPSLTFEVTADPGRVAVADIAAELTDGALGGAGALMLSGFAASGDSIRGALETLEQACPMPLSDDGTVLRIAAADTAAIPPGLLGAAADTKAPARVRDRQDAGTLPDTTTLTYYEPARDYQAGLQRARRDGVGRRDDRIDLPAALSADEARALAEAALSRAWRERDRATVRVPWKLLQARAGMQAWLGDDGPWRIAGWTLERMALELALVRAGTATLPLAGAGTGADAGRAVGAPDVAAGATVLALLDLPALGDDLPTAPQLWVAAAGTGPGWRRASVSLSLDDETSWQDAGQTAMPATLGSAATVLGDAPAMLFDRARTVEVELLHAGMSLAGADDAALVGGANLAMLGDELVQFGVARQLTPTRWRLGGLVRGRRGTEWATAGHVAGERFVLIEAASLLALDIPLAALGSTLLLTATGPGDAGVAASARGPVVGCAVRPPNPIRLQAVRHGDGTIDLAWTRRSRRGWAWLDGGDVPLAEDAERYRVTLTPSTGAARTVDTTTAAFSYTRADQAADGAAGADGLRAAVVQLGTNAASETAATASWIW